MSRKAEKTEHSGPKKGRGAFYGRKAVAKKSSKKSRRAKDREEQRSADDQAAQRRSP